MVSEGKEWEHSSTNKNDSLLCLNGSDNNDLSPSVFIYFTIEFPITTLLFFTTASVPQVDPVNNDYLYVERESHLHQF